jgi:hypothetical protein
MFQTNDMLLVIFEKKKKLSINNALKYNDDNTNNELKYIGIPVYIAAISCFTFEFAFWILIGILSYCVLTFKNN